MIPIEKIVSNLTAVFGNLFNMLANGNHTITSMSPSLEEISFTVIKNGTEVTWDDDFEDFMDRLVCRIAMTGKAIILDTNKGDGTKVIQGWHLSGDASNPVPFMKDDMKIWYRKYSLKGSSKVSFIKALNI